MIEIRENVIYVQGAKRGAIYNLNNGKVYSINEEACAILDKYTNGEELSEINNAYINMLECKQLIDRKFSCGKYIPKKMENNLKLVWLEITQACNMKCVHCYEGLKHLAGNDLLTLEEWKNVIDQIKFLNVNRVVVIGGEPCIHKNIKEILKYLADNSIATTLFTNGYFLDEDLMKIIIDNQIDVKVSLYGHNKEIHDAITGVQGSFDKLISSMKILLHNGVKVNVAVTLMKENEKYAENIRMFLKTLNVTGIKFDVIREVIDGQQSAHMPTDTDVIESAYRRKANFSIDKKGFDEYINRNTCWYGRLVISENGDILPCVFERNIKCGNIKENNIIDIINSDKMKKCWNCDFSNIDECRDCEYRYACKDCRPMAIALGKEKGKNPRCLYNPYKGVWNNE